MGQKRQPSSEGREDHICLVGSRIMGPWLSLGESLSETMNCLQGGINFYCVPAFACGKIDTGAINSIKVKQQIKLHKVGSSGGNSDGET